MAMELSHDMLKICGCLEPKEIYTLHRSESTIRVNCDNEFFIEIQALSTPTERSSGANSFAGDDRSGKAASTLEARTKFGTDYETVKRMTEVASYGNVVVGPSFFRMRSGGLCAECPIGFASYEELCPPPLNAEIPFVSVTREHLRKAFEIVAQCPNGCVGLTSTEGGKLTILRREASTPKAASTPPLVAREQPERSSARITLTAGVEAASLEFGKDAVDRIILFLVSLHHQYVKLHIHKDLIFRIVAGGSETAIASTPNVANSVRARPPVVRDASVVGFVQSRTVITFYCGHFSCDQ